MESPSGTPVQMYTYAWGLDSYCSGHAIIGEATCDLHRYLEGVRYGLGFAWHKLLPAKVNVRVLDRNGQPVPDARVSCWRYPAQENEDAGDNGSAVDSGSTVENGSAVENESRVKHESNAARGGPFSSGMTDAAGLWDPGINKHPGPRFDPFNLPQYDDQILDATAQVFTVDLPGYSDFMIWGAEDTHAHSRYTLMQEMLLHPDGWTWDFKTLYQAGAPAPQFDVTAAVQGRKISLSVRSAAAGAAALQNKFRLYRRWEPTYAFERIAERGPTENRAPSASEGTQGAARPASQPVAGAAGSDSSANTSAQLIAGAPGSDSLVQPVAGAPGSDPSVSFTDDMAAADWFTKNRYRAAYYVTAVLPDGRESLPQRVYGIGLERVNGLSDLGHGRLMVAANCGKAEPFGMLCQGTTPAEEVIKHFRFGHTAAKIVGSQENPQRYYATLTASDLPGGERFFDLIQFDKPDRHNSNYPVLQTIAECKVTEFSTAAPYTVTIRPDAGARAPINAGDWAFVDDTRARIVQVTPSGGVSSRPGTAPSSPTGTAPAVASAPPGRRADAGEMMLTLDLPLFKEGQKNGLHLRIEFGGGTPGDNAELRELKNPRGLATTTADDGREYVVIADTGNARIVVWDAGTKYVTEWKPRDTADFNPVAVAADPRERQWVWVLDRQQNRASVLHRLLFAGGQLAETPDFPIEIDVRGTAASDEQGLAVASVPGGQGRIAALTDAAQGRVLEIDPYGVRRAADEPSAFKRFDLVATRTEALPPYVGDVKLTHPTDVAYSVTGGELRLYAVDGHNRVVRLR